MKKQLFLLLLTLISILSFSSCNQKNIQQLKEQVEKFNDVCPISYGDMFTLNSVLLNEETVEMRFSTNGNATSISALNNHKEELKDIMSIGLSKETSKRLLDNIIEAGANFRTIIVSGQSGERVIFDFTSNELERARNKYSNMTESQKLITNRVLGAQIRLPLQVDYITTMTGISITSSNLVYKYEINDRETGESFNEMKGLMKSITMSQINNQITQGDYLVRESNRQFFQALVDCGQGVSFEYYESNTRNRMSFNISVSELKEILSGEFQKDAPTLDDWNDFANALEELDELFGDDYDFDD